MCLLCRHRGIQFVCFSMIFLCIILSRFSKPKGFSEIINQFSRCSWYVVSIYHKLSVLPEWPQSSKKSSRSWSKFYQMLHNSKHVMKSNLFSFHLSLHLSLLEWRFEGSDDGFIGLARIDAPDHHPNYSRYFNLGPGCIPNVVATWNCDDSRGMRRKIQPLASRRLRKRYSGLRCHWAASRRRYGCLQGFTALTQRFCGLGARARWFYVTLCFKHTNSGHPDQIAPFPLEHRRFLLRPFGDLKL